jgi:hypothetical protein
LFLIFAAVLFIILLDLIALQPINNNIKLAHLQFDDLNLTWTLLMLSSFISLK